MTSNTIWFYKFAFIPHRCEASKTWFWLGKHYIRVTRYQSVFDDFRTTTWYRKEEGLQRILSQSS